MDIRIGNDIKLNLTIISNKDFNQANIKQLKCFLINTTLDKCTDGCRDCHWHKRFPREPFPQYYTPTPHALHTCGKPGYFFHPVPSKCEYDLFGRWFHDYHVWPGYNGFGVRPGKFSADPGYIMPLIPAKECCCCDKDNIFLAPHKIVDGSNKIEVYFPARDQRMCGSYKLVVVVTTYESGWGRTNLHTYTIDKGDVFTLVDDEHGMSGNISINLDTNQIENHNVVKVEPVFDTIYLQSNSYLHINSLDIQNTLYKLIATLDDDSKVQYNPNSWEYDKLAFTSSNPQALSVRSGGTLVSAVVNEDTEVTVTVTNPNSISLIGTFNVVVKTPAAGYIGFASTASAADLQISSLTEVDNVFGNHTVTNSTTGNYLWICSPKRVSDVNSSLFDVPIASVEEKTIDGITYYCYHCPNALIATTFDISIEEDLS